MAEARTHLVGVDLIELLHQVDDARPDVPLGVGVAASLTVLLARRRAHPPSEPVQRRPPAASTCSNGRRHAEAEVLQHHTSYRLHVALLR